MLNQKVQNQNCLICLQTFRIQDNSLHWCATLLPIFKKGDPLECSNYRGIANLSQWLKILSKIIYFQIDSYCEQIGVFKETQNGFRTARGRRDLILRVIYVQSLFLEKNLNLYMAFIDIAKAYDSIQRELIWKVLKKIGLPPLLIWMLKMIYELIHWMQGQSWRHRFRPLYYLGWTTSRRFKLYAYFQRNFFYDYWNYSSKTGLCWNKITSEAW